MVYVLVHVSAESDTAIYTGWDVYGANIIDSVVNKLHGLPCGWIELMNN